MYSVNSYLLIFSILFVKRLHTLKELAKKKRFLILRHIKNNLLNENIFNVRARNFIANDKSKDLNPWSLFGNSIFFKKLQNFTLRHGLAKE